jgi:hypothetical protein
MTSQGTPRGRFQRAIHRRHPEHSGSRGRLRGRAIRVFRYAASRRTPQPAANIAEPTSARIQTGKPVKGNSPDAARSGETPLAPATAAWFGSGLVMEEAEPASVPFEGPVFVVAPAVAVVFVCELVLESVVVTGAVVVVDLL